MSSRLYPHGRQKSLRFLLLFLFITWWTSSSLLPALQLRWQQPESCKSDKSALQCLDEVHHSANHLHSFTPRLLWSLTSSYSQSQVPLSVAAECATRQRGKAPTRFLSSS